MILSVGTTNQLQLNLLTQESLEIKKFRTKKLPNMPKVVDGVAAKDTSAKFARLKMLPVTNVKKGHFQNVCRSPASPTKKVYELEDEEEQEEGDEVLFLGEVQTTRGGVGPPNSGLMATVLASSWIPVSQSQSLVHIPRG